MLLHRCRLSRAFAGIAVFAIAFVATACGGEDANVESDPEGALRSAVEALGEWDGIALQLTLQADAAARDALLADTDMSEDDLDLLLTSSIGVVTTGDGDDGAAAFDVTVGGDQVAAVQIHDELDLYLRVDIAAIMELVDDPAAEAEIAEALGMADAFGLGEAATSLRAGEWIQLTGLQQAASLFGGMTGTEDPEPDEEEAERLAQEMAAATLAFLDADVDVTYVGSDDAGERVRATTDGAALRSYLADLSEIVVDRDLAGGFDAGVLEEDLDDIPADATISVDLWIDGGEVSQIAIDLAALDDSLTGELLLVVAMEEHTGGIEPPAEATAVDVFEIIGQFMGGFGGDVEEDGLWDDDGFEDDGFDEDGGFEPTEDEIDALVQELIADGECVTEEDLELIESFLGPEAGNAIRALVDEGIVEYC